MAVWRPSVLLLTATILATTNISAQQQLQLGVILAANSSSTLMVSYTLGETDATVSSPTVDYDVPPSAYSTTASTFVSDGYYLYLSESRLQIFNDSAGTLKLLHSYTLLSSCDNPRLGPGRGVLSSSLVNPVQAIALAECERQVYGLFPSSNGGFRLRKLLDVSTAAKASLTVLPLSDNTTIAMVTGREKKQFMQFSDLSGGSLTPGIKYFVSGISCLDSAPPLLPYDKDQVILRCPNGPSYFCTTIECKSQAITSLAGVNEVQVAFGRDIAAVLSSDSISIYSNRLTSLVCSIPITTEQLFNLTESAILILVNSTNISLHNATTCSPIAVIPIDTSTTWSIMDHQYLILTTTDTPNKYNFTIVDLITGDERMYSALLPSTPLAYHLRLISHSASSLPLPSPISTSSPAISTSPTTTNIEPQQSSQLSSTPLPTTPLSSNTVTTSIAPSTTTVPTSTSSSTFRSTSHVSDTSSTVPPSPMLNSISPFISVTSQVPSTTPSTITPAAFEPAQLAAVISTPLAVVVLIVLVTVVLVAISACCCKRSQVYKQASKLCSRSSSSCSGTRYDCEAGSTELPQVASPTAPTQATNSHQSTDTPSSYAPQDCQSVSSPSINTANRRFVISSLSTFIPNQDTTERSEVKTYDQSFFT